MKLLYSIHKYDVSLFTWLMNARIISVLIKTCRYISKTGDGELYLFIIGLFCLHGGFESPFLRAAALAFAIERPVYFVLKNCCKRNRPEAALQDFRSIIKPSDQFSFPSGHTSAAFMMATLLGYFIPSLMLPLLVWAALVGFSRIALGVHFPTDILVGVIMGISIAIFSLRQIL